MSNRRMTTLQIIRSQLKELDDKQLRSLVWLSGLYQQSADRLTFEAMREYWDEETQTMEDIETIVRTMFPKRGPETLLWLAGEYRKAQK